MTKTMMMFAPALILAACARPDAATRSYGNDALPGAEVTAFQAADARLHWADARIAYDDRQCAVYQGRDASGQVRREPLLDAGGQPICARR